ncbi:MAG: efflux RND transporter periplasmic adaptor subunit [Steroidobacteraceae bacterium]
MHFSGQPKATDDRVVDVSSRRAGGADPSPPPADGGMDKPIDRPPAWRRYGPYGAGALLLIVAVAWLLHGIGVSTYRVPADQLTIGTVTRGKFEDYIAVRATVAPLTTFYLTTEQGGGVQQVLAEDGAIVKAGQPLIVLSNTALRLQVASREADISSQINTIESTKLQLEDTRFKYQSQLLDIQHQLAVLKSDLARDKILLDGNAIAPTLYAQEQEQYRYELQLRDATIVSRDAEQQLRSSQLAQLGKTLAWLKDNIVTARTSLDALTIRAPTAGQLTALDAKVGQSKMAGAVLGQVDSRDSFKLTADVDEFYLGRIALGQTALFTVADRDFKATVVKIYPQVSDGTFKVDLHFDGAAPEGITVGQAIDTKLELGGAASASMLPNGPFYQDTGGQWAFVLMPDGKFATRRKIELGRRNPDHVEVLDGLEPGERVIVSSYQGFEHVQRVELEKSNHQN